MRATLFFIYLLFFTLGGHALHASAASHGSGVAYEKEGFPKSMVSTKANHWDDETFFRIGDELDDDDERNSLSKKSKDLVTNDAIDWLLPVCHHGLLSLKPFAPVHVNGFPKYILIRTIRI